MAELVLAWSSNELGVVYKDFVALLNWLHPIPTEVMERVTERTVDLHKNKIPHNDYRTSSQQVKATVGTFHTLS